MYKSFSALALAASAAALAVATPAQAGQGEDSVIVSYSDLDLSTADDQAQLDRRIRRAARSVCGDFVRETASMRAQVASCQEAAIASAKAELETAQASKSGSFRLALRAR